MLKAKRLLFAFLFFLAIVPVSCEKEINEEEIYESDNEAIKTRLDLSEVELRNIEPSNDFAFSFFKGILIKTIYTFFRKAFKGLFFLFYYLFILI